MLIDGTILASGTTQSVFTQENLQAAFGGVLRRYVLTGKDLHDDDDTRQVTVLSVCWKIADLNPRNIPNAFVGKIYLKELFS